ncbi:Uncharacterised protein [Starkeya nomas]|uniref:Porin domain-containing protein n=1 Tax=Starkeya nomas TaxID=2666134 RepID=A0A5S9NXS1_9HYPH|nr:hypothetical protein [Starkeya nomas]CAA0095620.1 Uncharacterised protein [Starkeya nomas]
MTRMTTRRSRALIASATFIALAVPAVAQSNGSLPGYASNPWSGISVLVTPPEETDEAGTSPYEAAHHAADEAPATGAPAEPPAQVEPFDPDAEMAVAPSLWDSIELGLGRPVEAEEKDEPPLWLVPGPAPETKRAKLPTNVEVKQGAASLSVSSSASATAPVSGLLNKTTTSGSGEIKGRVGLQQDNLSVYSTGTLGASADGRSASLYDNLSVGSSYHMPLGARDEKLGATVEVNSGQTVTTGVELRAPSGSYERFISLQRSISPDSDPSGTVKAGVLGKF